MYLLGIHLYQFSNRLWGPAEINICIEAKSQLKAEKNSKTFRYHQNKTSTTVKSFLLVYFF